MHYQSLLGIAAAALVLGLSSPVVAQSANGKSSHQSAKSIGQILRLAPIAFRLDGAARSVSDQGRKLSPEQDAAYKWQAAAPATSETAAEALPDDALRIAPEQRTKSAAYRWEAAFLALSAIDAIETISCSSRNQCNETNFIWGRHPSTSTIVAAKLGLGLVHLGIFKLIADRDPHTALRAAQVSAAVQGGVVLLNLNTAF